MINYIHTRRIWRTIMRIIIFLFTLFIGNINVYASSVSALEAINRERVAHLDIECISFTGESKTLPLNVLDTVKDDVVEIFKCLGRGGVKFPIYTMSCYAPRDIRGGGFISLHAYAAAIDINYLMNPHYNVINHAIIPGRYEDRKKDEEEIVRGLRSINIPEDEIKAILEVVIQPAGSDDWFLNRGIDRKGMVTSKVVDIFKMHGFNIWGGNWRQPMDYMHFQLPRSLAEQLAIDDAKKTAGSRTNKEIWEEHKAKVLSQH